MRGEDKEINAQPMSPAGKKRQLVESGGGARKKAVNSPSLENSCSVRSFLKPMDGGTAADTVFEFKSGDDASAQHVELNYDEQTGTVALDDSADESDPICLKRKRSLRVTTLNHLRSGREQSIRANTRGCSKKSRADAQKKISEQNREPSVILAWKHRCMYENDGEEIDTLVNKRDERRRLERQNDLQHQDHKQEDAADSTEIEASENVMSSRNEAEATSEQVTELRDESQTLGLPVVTESSASHVDKRRLSPGDLQSLTGSEDRPVHAVSGEGAEGSNTPAEIDSKPRKSPARQRTSDSGIEIASGSIPTVAHLGVSGLLGGDAGIQSRAGSTQAFIIGDQHTDPSFFSAQEHSMVLDGIAEGVTTNSIAARTSNESISQSTLNDICTKPKAHGADKKKYIHQSGTSYFERHGDDLIVDLDQQEDGTNGVEPAVEQLGVGDSAGCGVPDSFPESSNQPYGSYPTARCCGTSEQDWGQSSGSVVPVVATYLELEVCEEQGESIGVQNEVAHRRGKQKVFELSDEEGDSNRVSIGRRGISGQHSSYGLKDRVRSYGNGGGSTISGAEISSVHVGTRFAGAGRHITSPEYPRLVDYDDTDGGTVESNAPFQASAGLDADFEEQLKTYRRRRTRNQGKAIAGEDSGEEVRGPTTRRDGESSDVDSHEGQLGGEVRREVFIPIYCPVCNEELEAHISNNRINDHIDKCLGWF